jgi:hypothetical protein
MIGDSAPWPVWQRIAFRFFSIFWLLRLLLNSPLFTLLGTPGDRVQTVLSWPLRELALWLGIYLFHLDGVAATFHPTGSSDTALKWILALDSFVVGVIGAGVWTLLDRRRLQYRRLDAWLRMLLSFTLGATMLSYGFDKVLPSQFGTPSLYTLNETYGASSPMRLLWTFMAASKGYQFFTGWAEVVPGVLLFFRRTRTIGCLLCAGVLSNVVALNFFYDVPVKLYSVSLLFLALWLAIPDGAAIFRLFFLRQQAQLSEDHIKSSSRRWLRYTTHVLQIMILLFFVGTSFHDAWQFRDQAGVNKPLLYGAWDVKEVSAAVAPPWSRVYAFAGKGALATGVQVRKKNGEEEVFAARTEARSATLLLTAPNHEDSSFHYAFDPADNKLLHFSGIFQGREVRFDLKRIDPDEYPLQSRRFRWISEFPFNR